MALQNYRLIIDYHTKHPDFTPQRISRIFGIDEKLVAVFIKSYKACRTTLINSGERTKGEYTRDTTGEWCKYYASREFDNHWVVKDLNTVQIGRILKGVWLDFNPQPKLKPLTTTE
ncbi:MAG: hypothetical protein HUK08_00255 [Bacteroidaceae bacterium]|nr:hypothetical protein [Bacteroidaceae bacterium]